MSSFFTLPASQRKRKRPDQDLQRSRKQRTTASSRNPSTRSKHQKSAPQAPEDDSISGSSDESADDRITVDDEQDQSSASSSDHEDETAAERRLRLAEKYLETIRSEVGEQQVGFDAEEIDRDLIAERLREDVAEGKGKLYRKLASSLDLGRAVGLPFRKAGQSLTGVAVCMPHVYVTSKDISITNYELKTADSSPANSSTSTRAFSLQEVARTRGDHRLSSDHETPHHSSPILCTALSASGSILATGGSTDRKLILWSTPSLTPLKSFTHHRDSILSLSFQRNKNILYSSSKDRTVKEWDADSLGYVVTLFGHQDEAPGVSCLGRERCVSVGARDRSARFWNVIEETHTLHLGGGGGGGKRSKGDGLPAQHFAEGSIDRVAMVDEETWVTGSDNGSLCLWSAGRKKPLFTIPVAHGLDLPSAGEKTKSVKTIFNDDGKPQNAKTMRSMVADSPPPIPQPRWITALTAVPYSDLILSGSWDGHVRAWKVSEDKKRLEALGPVRYDPTLPTERQLRDGRRELKARRKDASSRGLPTPQSLTSRSSITSLTLDRVPVATALLGPDVTTPDASPVVEDGEGPTSLPAAELGPISGVINDLAIGELGSKGRDGFIVAAAGGRQHTLGRR